MWTTAETSHHAEHDRCQRVDPERPGELEGAAVDPGEELGGARVAAQRHVDEDDHREQRRQHQARAGDELRAAVAQGAAEEAGEDGAEQRQEYDRDVQHRLSPSSC